jgi:FKBP-type peptidyl-prolyl cis-trans isomerase 2
MCRSEPQLSELVAQNGDTISVHYIGKFPGGKVFDTSMKSEATNAGLFSPARDYKPLQVVLGAHQVIAGFEEALVGMKVNETKEVTISPEKGYGRTGRHPMAGKTLQFKLLVTSIKRPRAALRPAGRESMCVRKREGRVGFFEACLQAEMLFLIASKSGRTPGFGAVHE